MTPQIYAGAGRRLAAQRPALRTAVVVALVLVVVSVMAPAQVDALLPHELSFALGLMLLIGGFGGIMAVHWFAPGGTMAADTVARLDGAEQRLRRGLAWYAAAVLSVWLLSGVLVVPFMMWRVWASA